MTKTVLITGSTSGIGLAAAEKFAAEGFELIIHGQNPKKVKQIVSEFRQQGSKATGFAADFTDPEAINQLFTQIKQENPKIDILVNNAGIVNRKKIPEFTAADFQKLLMVNLTAVFLCSRAAYDLGASSIVNIGSMRGFSQEATTPDYSASKAAVHNLTVSLARAFAPRCRVNCVAPGFTKTPFHSTAPERLEKEASITPLAKCASSEEIAESIYFLASDQSSFTTGAVLLVDGGRNFV
jgi:NAD(P)-dependent dehydrogenase (short-subunit alcohol dehydrogenase family)